MLKRTLALATVFAVSVSVAGATAQTTTTGSVGCSTLVQAAANGMTARMAADNQTINKPTSVTQMTNLLNPTTLLQSVEGQICQAVQSTWSNWTSGLQCGLTVTGFNFGFGGLGGGLACPKLTFGAGGPPISTIGLGTGTTGSGTGLYINGTGMTPPGYNLPQTPVGGY
jgi:hypothetical protein